MVTDQLDSVMAGDRMGNFFLFFDIACWISLFDEFWLPKFLITTGFILGKG